MGDFAALQRVGGIRTPPVCKGTREVDERKEGQPCQPVCFVFVFLQEKKDLGSEEGRNWGGHSYEGLVTSGNLSPAESVKENKKTSLGFRGHFYC